ncbi:hypothetical protein KU43P_22910 [Pseudomonas sp. KU43P]|nr:hypothetical protein KU43P_22910 [Pseudomonas sp. KU43P]
MYDAEPSVVLPSCWELISVAPSSRVAGFSSSARAGLAIAMHTAMARRLRAGRGRVGARDDDMDDGFLNVIEIAYENDWQ